MRWRVLPDNTHRGIAPEPGEIDFDVYVTLRSVEALEAHPDIEVRMIGGTAHHKLILNNDLPQFYDYRVRKAPGMAIDKDAVILAGLSGFAIPA